MASPDDARVDEARDQSTVPTSPPAADTGPPTSTGITSGGAGGGGWTGVGRGRRCGNGGLVAGLFDPRIVGGSH